MSKERTGSCGCGKITARISGEPENVVVCYCIPCQKACGDALQTNVFFSPKKLSPRLTQQVEWSDPESQMRTYAGGETMSGKPLLRGFCGNCGSRIRTMPSAPDPSWVVLAMGFVDGDNSDLKPDVELYAKRRPSWLAPLAEGKCSNQEEWRYP